MYHGSLPEASNRATYTLLLGAQDAFTGADLDMSIYTIVFEVADPRSTTIVLSATTTAGDITFPSVGTFQIDIPRTELVGIEPKTYNAGITVADADNTRQYFIGTLPVLDGVVSQ